MKANSLKSSSGPGARRALGGFRQAARYIACAIVLSSALAGAVAQAGVIYGGNVSSPTSFTGCQAASHAGDQSGLSTGYVSGVTDFATYTATTTHQGVPCNTGFASTGGGFAIFTMDMLTPVTVDALAFWSGDLGPAPGPVSFRLYADGDANFFGGAPLSASLTSGSIPVTGLAGVFGFATTTSRYFHVLVFPQPGLGQASVGELALRGVPEPGTLALAGISLIGLGALQRRGRPLGAAAEGGLA